MATMTKTDIFAAMRDAGIDSPMVLLSKRRSGDFEFELLAGETPRRKVSVPATGGKPSTADDAAVTAAIEALK